VSYVGSEPWTLPGPSSRIYPIPGEPKRRRISPLNHAEIIAYNLRGGGNEFTTFEYAQTDRVMKTRALIDRIISHSGDKVTRIVEPGCSTGDISGPFAGGKIKVTGIDVTPGAAAAARERWPKMTVINKEAEEVEPMACDILVMCEFLEHISFPDEFIARWMPKARYTIISHPLVGDGHDPETGHLWAHHDVDFANWFPTGGHELREAWEFPMGYRMVIGWGERK
jgi:2-polyprenyl-3-methyl-5-hydroxy-6-metoxy-1,4-benzoquinol methylase